MPFLLLGGCAVSPPPATRIATPTAGLDRLVGATPAMLEAALGPPLLLRRDGPAEVWLYRSSRCAIDLVLYRDPATGAARVATADARPLGVPPGTPVSDAGCLASLPSPPGKVASSND